MLTVAAMHAATRLSPTLISWQVFQRSLEQKMPQARLKTEGRHLGRGPLPGQHLTSQRLMKSPVQAAGRKERGRPHDHLHHPHGPPPVGGRVHGLLLDHPERRRKKVCAGWQTLGSPHTLKRCILVGGCRKRTLVSLEQGVRPRGRQREQSMGLTFNVLAAAGRSQPYVSTPGPFFLPERPVCTVPEDKCID
jgi:hypothetical protein